MVVYRKLRSGDRAAHQELLLGLSEQERRLRFHSAISDDAIIAHCRTVDWLQTILIGAFVDGQLRGVAELRFDRPFLPQGAELGVTVAHDWQGRGLGQELAYRAATIARNRGIRELVMLCLPENQKMQKIARHLGGVVELEDGGLEAHVKLGVPTPLTLLLEVFGESSGTLLGWSARSAA